MPHPPERKVGQGFTDCDLTGLLPQIHRLKPKRRNDTDCDLENDIATDAQIIFGNE